MVREQSGSRRTRSKTGASTGGVDGPGDLLLLTRENERAPWFDIEDEEESSAFDPRRVFLAALIGCAVVAAVIAGVFWLVQQRSGAEIVADGSVIEAPDQPYKTRPADAGGVQVAGTGDVSFEVAEGREHEGIFAPDAFQAADVRQAGASPMDASQTDASRSAAAPSNVSSSDASSSAPTPSAPSEVGVQVGAFATRDEARAGWERMRARSEALQGRSYRIVEGSADSGPVFGLQVVAASAAEAVALCRAIRDGGGDCQIKR